MPDAVNKQLVLVWEKASPRKMRYGFIGPAAVPEEVIDHRLLLVVGKQRGENLFVEGSKIAIRLWWIQLLDYPMVSQLAKNRGRIPELLLRTWFDLHQLE